MDTAYWNGDIVETFITTLVFQVLSANNFHRMIRKFIDLIVVLICYFIQFRLTTSEKQVIGPHCSADSDTTTFRDTDIHSDTAW